MRARRLTRLVMLLLLVLSLAAPPTARATVPSAGEVGYMDGYLTYGRTRSTTTWGCYVSGDGLPFLLNVSDTTGTWSIESWLMSNVWWSASLDICGDWGPIRAANQPIGADCAINSGRRGEGTLWLADLKGVSRTLQVLDAGWKVASDGLLIVNARLEDAAGVPAGHFSAILAAGLLLCPSSSTSFVGAWSIVPATGTGV